MNPNLTGSLERLVESHYAAWAGVAELVERWTEIARIATRSSRADVVPALRGPLRVALGAGLRPAAADPPGPYTFPIRYQATELGRLFLVAPGLDPEEIEEVGRRLAKDLAFEVMRIELAAGVRARFACEPPWFGPSSFLRRVDRFVEQAAQSVLPALLVGDEGTQAETVALALHLASPRSGQRAVQLRCSILEPASVDEQLARFARAAAGGTLILSRLDELASGCQAELCRFLDAQALGTDGLPLASSELPTWIATASAAIDEAAESGRFFRPLLDRLDILRLSIEPLHQRQPDIGFLFQHCFRQFAPARPIGLSGDVLAALRSYRWPGDVAELRRVAARLAVMVDESAVEMRHLHQLTPQVVSPLGRALPSASFRDRAPEESGTRGPRPIRTERPAALPALPAARHPSVRRAMAFLLANYRRKLPLAEVASHVFVSASRLAHLFRQDLGSTFTQVLARIRIEQAKQLLLSLPWEPITAVASAVGFADLRHFERVFRLVEGSTPKEFRRLYGERQPPRKRPATLDPAGTADRIRSETN